MIGPDGPGATASQEPTVRPGADERAGMPDGHEHPGESDGLERHDPPARRRPPPARISPEALAAARGGAVEGLDWLGRTPESSASLLYRLVRLVARFTLFVVFRFHLSTEGREHLPAGGYFLVAAAHRGWMDPFVVLHAIPTEPRAWFLGSGPSTFTSRWRERFVHRLGGLLPVWRGGVGIEGHVASARAVTGNGGVFVQMPEGTVSGPPGRIGQFRVGWAVIAMRTDGPIVPLAMAGTDELYVGRRMASRVLPATSARALAGLPPDAPLPPEDSREELDVARRMNERLSEMLGPVVVELYARTVDPPGHPRRLRHRLTWLLLRPGRLDRDG
jgi:1-acyl-sn-glycerol-3-phosphate acyltransferase